MIAATVDEFGTRRAVTKLVEGERLVSCTCCTTPSGCCMYPADQLGVGYAAADLPDAVTINWAGHVTGSASKSGSSYTSGTVTLAVNSGGTAWVLTDTSTAPATTRTVGNCLIIDDGNFTPGDDLVEDQFADTYTVEFLTNKEVTVTRQSLCSWFGTATIDGFEYEASLGYNDQTFQWEAGFSTVDISSGFNPKDGNQNTPVGTYSGDNVITVSE